MSSPERDKVNDQLPDQIVKFPRSNPTTVVDELTNETSKDDNSHPHMLSSISELPPLPTPSADNALASESMLPPPIAASDHGHWLQDKVVNFMPMTIPFRTKEGSSSTFLQHDGSMSAPVTHELNAAPPSIDARQTRAKRSYDSTISPSIPTVSNGIVQSKRKKKKARRRAIESAENDGMATDAMQLDTKEQSQAKRRRVDSSPHTSLRSGRILRNEDPIETERKVIMSNLARRVRHCSSIVKRTLSKNQHDIAAVLAEVESEVAMDGKSLWDAMLAITENFGKVRENENATRTFEQFVARGSTLQDDCEGGVLPSRPKGRKKSGKTISDDILGALKEWEQREDAKLLIKKQTMYELLINRTQDSFGDLGNP